jgi:exopolysaccharide biosynthesis WecB/TagA/CpsF family protein
MKKYTNIMGIPVSTLSRAQTVSEIEEMINTFKTDHKSRYVATLNMDFLSNCFNTLSLKIKNHKLHEALLDADLITADGMPIVLMGRLQNNNVTERVCGSDLVNDLASMANQNQYSLYFIGESDSLCKAAKQQLETKYPGIKVSGFASPKFDKSGQVIDDGKYNNESLVKTINDSKADILLIGIGNPKQECWFQNNRNKLQVPLSIGVGGSLNLLTKRVKRAPLLLQKIGLEWLFRLSQEPKRLWKRYSSQLSLLAVMILRGRLGIIKFIYSKIRVTQEIIMPVKHVNGEVFFNGIVGERTILTLRKILKKESIRKIHFEDVTEIKRNALGELLRVVKETASKCKFSGLSTKLQKELYPYFSDKLINPKAD